MYGGNDGRLLRTSELRVVTAPPISVKQSMQLVNSLSTSRKLLSWFVQRNHSAGFDSSIYKTSYIFEVPLSLCLSFSSKLHPHEERSYILQTFKPDYQRRKYQRGGSWLHSNAKYGLLQPRTLHVSQTIICVSLICWWGGRNSRLSIWGLATYVL